MTTFKTGNPVPSSAIRDLYDNAENFDEAMNGDADTWLDRRGVRRLSWSGFIATKGIVRYATWDELVAVAPSVAGAAAEVISDDGTHVDPVSGAVVDNSGQYTWNGQSWEWLRGDLLPKKLDIATYRETFPDPARFARSGYTAAIVGAEFRVDEAVRNGVKRFEMPVSVDVLNGVGQIVSERWSRCGYKYAVVGDNMRIVFPAQEAEQSAGRAPDDYIVYAAADSDNAGKMSVFAELKETGQRTRLSSLGSNETSPRIVGSAAVWSSDRAGAAPGAEYFSPLDRADEHPVRPVKALACFGDSLTAQNWMEFLPDAGIDVPSYNYGRSGDTSRAVASRFGAYRNIYSVAGGAIPGAGTVALTRLGEGDPTSKYGGADTTVVGYLAGVLGKLKSTSGALTFERMTTGAATPVEGGVEFIWAPSTGGDWNPPDDTTLVRGFRDMTVVLFFGRNNSTETDQIVSDFAACISAISSMTKRFVVIPYLPASYEPAGTDGSARRAALVSRAAALWPHNTLDLLPALKAAGDGSANDNADVAANLVPRSLMQVDGTHPNDAGKKVEAAAIAAFINTRGTLS